MCVCMCVSDVGSYTKHFIARTMFGHLSNHHFYNGQHPSISAVYYTNWTVYEKVTSLTVKYPTSTLSPF